MFSAILPFELEWSEGVEDEKEMGQKFVNAFVINT
jgi:hypothetical protein